MKNTARLAGTVTFVVATVVGVAVAPIASADPADDQYLHILQQHGLGWPSGQEQMMIDVGHAVCTDWAGGDTMKQLATDVQKATGLSSNGSGTIIGAATAAYCPEFRSKM
jgi:Protein of unknown function (DUF732)